jgi:hypothetical protein
MIRLDIRQEKKEKQYKFLYGITHYVNFFRVFRQRLHFFNQL